MHVHRVRAAVVSTYTILPRVKAHLISSRNARLFETLVIVNFTY